MNYATDISPIVLDIETSALPNAADYLEPVQPAKNLVDPAKVKADIEKRTAERDDKLALDWNVGRIIAIGYWAESLGTRVYLCPTEEDEQRELSVFWHHVGQRTIVGFNVKSFDLPYMVQRSRYLGVSHPQLDFGKYSRRGIEDLFLDLTFNAGTYDQGAMRRTLKAFARRFGLPVNDEIDGKDIQALVAADNWAGIESHLRSDIDLTVALARRLGIVRQAEPAGVA